METLNSPFGSFELSRYPKRQRETLRAWDAADEYILQHISDEQLIDASTRVLILNDQFGAMTVALHQYDPCMITDSWLAQAGTEANAVDNQIDKGNIFLFDSLNYPDQPFDLVLIKIPKSLAMLEDQLIRLRPLLHNQSKVVAGGMVKTIHTSTLKLFEKYLGDTKTSLARKKARLIFPSLVNNAIEVPSPYPSSYVLEGTDYLIKNHAAVFSRDSLDIGTRFFLQHIPQSDQFEKIIDLGCGNGVVGLLAAEKNPNANLHFVDESFMAVESARENFFHAFDGTREAEFTTTDCLQGLTKQSADLVLNNPPFHQQNVVGDFIALQMFRESFNVLRSGGELWVIGNRHLGYHIKLKKLFGNCYTEASNKKFVILKAIKA